MVNFFSWTGHYCGEVNLTAPSGLCRAGFYCPLSATREDFIECPEGYFCIEGSSTYAPCPNGKVYFCDFLYYEMSHFEEKLHIFMYIQ